VLARSHGLALFSAAYNSQVKFTKTYMHSKLSGRKTKQQPSFAISVIEKMTVLALKKSTSAHSIKLIRSTIRTVKSVFSKLLQDYVRLKSCSDCAMETKEKLLLDLKAILSLLEFTFKEYEPNRRQFLRKQLNDFRGHFKTNVHMYMVT